MELIEEGNISEGKRDRVFSSKAKRIIVRLSLKRGAKNWSRNTSKTIPQRSAD